MNRDRNRTKTGTLWETPLKSSWAIEGENELDKKSKRAKRNNLETLHKTHVHTEQSRLQLFNIIQPYGVHPEKKTGYYRAPNPDKNTGTSCALAFTFWLWTEKYLSIKTHTTERTHVYMHTEIEAETIKAKVLIVSSYLKAYVQDSHIQALDSWFGNMGWVFWEGVD